MGLGKEFLGPVREALRNFEAAVRKDRTMSFEGKAVRRQDVDRARERVMDAVMEMAKKLEERVKKQLQ